MDDQQKASVIKVIRDGGTLGEAAEAVNTTYHGLLQARYADRTFDAQLVEASSGRVKPVLLRCPGADCGKSISYTRKGCRKKACADAHRALNAATPSGQARRRPGDQLSPAEAARVLGLTVPLVDLLQQRGLLAPQRCTIGGHRRFSRSDVDRLAAELHEAGPRLAVAATQILAEMAAHMQAGIDRLNQAVIAALTEERPPDASP